MDEDFKKILNDLSEKRKSFRETSTLVMNTTTPTGSWNVVNMDFASLYPSSMKDLTKSFRNVIRRNKIKKILE